MRADGVNDGRRVEGVMDWSDGAGAELGLGDDRRSTERDCLADGDRGRG